MNYLLIYLKFIDQIVINHDKHQVLLRHSPSVLCPKSSTPTVNAPIDLLANPTRLCPCWLLLNTHLTPNYNHDLDVIHNCTFKDHINYFSTYILSLNIMDSVGGG